MRISLFTICLCTSFIALGQGPTTRYDRSNGTQTPTYSEIISWWQKMDLQSGKIRMTQEGMTDAGYPLHLVIIAANGDYNLDAIHKNNKRIILINNGIHPGEPDGIDATMLLAKEIVNNKFNLPDNIVLAIIPVYNIGGCLDRSANYRVDQNGPEEFGFRGNSQNLDLNRDFIKCDSKDARAFTQIFHKVDPDVFVDNHVSNGADYQHVMTLLSSQHDKLGGEMGSFMNKQFEPALYLLMKQRGYDMVPYVNHFSDTPENGWQEFWDSPRYGSGYGTLWQTFSFVPETHMLKPYKQRVEATEALLKCFIEFTSTHNNEIKTLRDKAKRASIEATEFPVTWQLDNSTYQEYLFKGYRSGYKKSEISGLQRLYYDRASPYEKMVRIQNHYMPLSFVKKPAAYIIPQGWWKVIDLLQLNKVNMQPLKKDSIVEVEVYHIADYKTSPRQYEMHHLNSAVKVEASMEKMHFRKGDWYIPMNQPANRFIIETLEPQAEDSYFAWNYFDAILGQKEGYSAYMFEDFAADWLKSHPETASKLAQRRASDTAFANNANAQLNFIYQHSQYFEPAYMRYPVYRVIKSQ